jgi:hypothetical protein
MKEVEDKILKVTNEMIVACARDNGYKGKENTPHKKEINGKIEWRLYSITEDSTYIYSWVVKEEEFKQWQRNYKIEQLINEDRIIFS